MAQSDMNHEMVTQDGEIVGELPAGYNGQETSLAVSLARAEVDQQVATARALPRNIKRLMNNILSLATLDEKSAEECVYAVPRGGKTIKGPSVRLAEIIASQWGNNRVGARVVHVDRSEKYIEAEGIFHDLETNAATTARVRRSICDSKGRIFKDDMIIVTGNAAGSIAKRNAILGGVPKAVWRKAYDEVEKVVAGDIKTLVERRDAALKAFAHLGVIPDRVFLALGVTSADEITLEHMPVLSGARAALKSGEATIEEMFPAAGQDPKSDGPRDLKSRLQALASTNSAPTPNHGTSAGADTPDTRSGGPSAEGSASPSADNPNADKQQDSDFPGDQPSPIERARAAGRTARGKNMSRKSVAAEFKKDEQLLAAWTEGFDEGAQ